MPFTHPIYDPKEEGGAPPPGMTQEQLDYFSDQTRRAVRKAVRNYARGAVVGFFILLAGIGGAIYTSNQDVSNSSADSFQAVVKSGRIVAVDGCNRDFRNIGHIRDLLERLQTANEVSFKAGRITQEQFDQAQQFYSAEIAKQVLPDCRMAKEVLTDNPSNLGSVPDPLYPSKKDG